MSQADRGPDLDISDEGSDSSLIRRFRSGEDDAATKLYKRYAERLQEAFAQAVDEACTCFKPSF